jgi:hypothetical protein
MSLIEIQSRNKNPIHFPQKNSRTLIGNENVQYLRTFSPQ